jgi:hypothetical protein
MKRMATVLALVVMALGVIAPDTASAHGRGRVSVGVGFGFGGYWPGYWGGWPGYWGGWPGYWGGYYPAPYYSAYPEAVVTTPPTYIERGDAQPQPAAQAQPAANAPRRDWWYYCPETQTYYPYVKQCAGGWQRVEPRPPGETPEK